MGTLGLCKCSLGLLVFFHTCLRVCFVSELRRIDQANSFSRYVVLITLFPIMFAAPPYSFSESTQGLLYIASAIGNVIGGFVCGQLNDIISRRATRKNLGVFEPEMRLPVILFPAIVVPIGLVLAGVGFSFHLHWILPTIGLACAAAGLTGIPSVSQPYLLDSYYPVAMDCLIVRLILHIFTNLLLTRW